MFILYDLIFLIFTLIYLPIYLFKGKFHQGFLRRLGILPKGLNLDKPFWIHAVSLGEAISLRGLIGELRKCYPAKQFVFSTVTPTGNKIFREIAREGDLVTYLPLDFSFTVKKVIDKVRPNLFIIAETEIWPNLITYLGKKNIPIVIVNGRISDASLKGYSAVRLLIAPILNKVRLFCMQSDADAARLKQLGFPGDKIKVTGNMKFDQLNPGRGAGCREKLGLSPQEKLFLCGSTHPQEEEIILSVYKNLLKKFSGLRLLIAPRHTQRSGEILKLANGFGFCCVEASKINPQNLSAKPVFILDTVGNLADFYAAADIVFVGGSLVKRGGHNILEPAGAGKPVIFGPQMFNFRDVARIFLDNHAAIMVKSAKELESAVEELFNNSAMAAELTANARRVILQNQGATARNIGAIKLTGAA